MLRKCFTTLCFLVVLPLGTALRPVAAQLATFDAANYAKNTLNETHLWYVQYQQAQQLAAQLQQLAQEVRSGALPTTVVWRDAQASLQQLAAQVGANNAISVSMDNLGAQFAQLYPGCGACNTHYGYDAQVRAATTQAIQNALQAAASSNAQFAQENLDLDTLKNAQLDGSQYAAIMLGNEISAMLVEQEQKERFNQTLLLQAEGAYYINQVQRQNEQDQSNSQVRAMWNYFLHGMGTDPETMTK